MLAPRHALGLRIAEAALGSSVPDIANALRTLVRGSISGLVASGINGMAHENPELRALIDEQVLPDFKPKPGNVLNQYLIEIKDLPIYDICTKARDHNFMEIP